MHALPHGSVGSGSVWFSLRPLTRHGCYRLLSLLLPCLERRRYRCPWVVSTVPWLGWSVRWFSSGSHAP